MGVQDRLGHPGRTRRPRHERNIGVVRRGTGEQLDPVAGQQRGGARGVEHVGPLGLGRPGVDGHEHGAGEPDPEHRGDRVGPVGELDRDRPAGCDARVAQYGGDVPRSGSGRTGGKCLGDRVQQRLVVRSRMFEQQPGQRSRLHGFADLPFPLLPTAAARQAHDPYTAPVSGFSRVDRLGCGDSRVGDLGLAPPFFHDRL